MATLKIIILRSKMPAELLALSDKSDDLVIMNIIASNRSAANTILSTLNDDFWNSSEIVINKEGAVQGIPLPKEAGKKYQ